VKLHAELAAVLGGRAPTEEDVGKLVYTRMVIEESMRLYPPVHTIARTALADDTLAGRPIPKGSSVLIVPWVLHRHRLCGRIREHSSRSGSPPSNPPHDRASRTCPSAAGAVSASAPLSR
jgi:hypothetical protein